MVVSCCVLKCKERFVKGNGITFHAFPHDPDRRALWIEALNRENFNPSKASRVCSKHFEASCFKPHFGKFKLLKTAVPTIFDFSFRPEDAHLKRSMIINKWESDLAIDDGESYLESKVFDTGFDIDKEYFLKISQNVGIDFGTKKKKKRRPRRSYVGDFKETDLKKPEAAENFLKLAQKQLALKNQKIKVLKSRNMRLINKCNKLQALLDHLRQENSRKYKMDVRKYKRNKAHEPKTDDEDQTMQNESCKPEYLIFDEEPQDSVVIFEEDENQEGQYYEEIQEQYSEPQIILKDSTPGQDCTEETEFTIENDKEQSTDIILEEENVAKETQISAILQNNTIILPKTYQTPKSNTIILNTKNIQSLQKSKDPRVLVVNPKYKIVFQKHHPK